MLGRAMTKAAASCSGTPTCGSCDADERRDCAQDAPRETSFVVVSHEALFTATAHEACDACGAALPKESESEAYELCGRGVYLWIRGGESRLEDAPLCASCASAIGMTALARWEIEEEEG
jgi:hypothetical protein